MIFPVDITTHCLLCQSSRCTVIRTKLRHDVMRDVLQCEDCDFIFLRRTPEGSKNYYQQEDYRKKHGPDLTKQSSCQEAFDIYFPFQQPIIDHLQPILHKDMKVLDVGCSTGHFLTALKGMVQTRVGLELSQDEVHFVREHLDFPVYDEPIETAEMNEGPFDLITVLQVLEHIDDPIPFLENIKRHLKPNGYIYIEVPNLHDILLDEYKAPGYADFYFRDPHVSYFSADTLKSVTSKSGYTGSISNVQRFNVLNHIHWSLVGKPMPNFVLGNRDPLLIEGDSAVATDLNAFIQKADKEYKKIVEKHGLGESVTFLGKKQ